jgi:hypothetical protein
LSARPAASGTASRGHHPVRAGSAGRQRACLARRGGQRDHRRRPRRAHPVETASAISETNFSLLAWEARTAQQMWGDGEAEAKYDIRVNCYLYGKRLRAGSRWGVCEQTPECRREHRRSPARLPSGAGLRPLRLAVRLLRLWGDVAAAQHTARSCSAEMPRRAACTAGFGTMAAPRDSRSCACPATSPRARANGARSHIDSKKRCYACNEIKLLVTEFGTDRTARDGHARAARCATPQPEQ